MEYERNVGISVKIYFNELSRQYSYYKEEYKKAAIDVLESGWYTLGKRLERFEAEFAAFHSSKYCVGVNSGLDALTLAIRALGIGPGDEVIVPANTYIASVLAITENGASPIFVEPDEYYNMNAATVESCITARTKAILLVHLYGQAANALAIKEIALKHHLKLIEDCAQSHGAKFLGRMTGTFGDIGCFSFFPTKNLGAFGDGGAIITEDEDIAEKIKMLRNYGSKVKYINEIEGMNSKLDEIQAALLSVKLAHLEEINKERIQLAKTYQSKIKNERIMLPQTREGAEHVYHLFVVRTENRNDFQNYLKAKDIDTQIHYPIPPHLAKCYGYLGKIVGSYPVTEEYANTVISLPLYIGMTKEEQEYVIRNINSY